MMTTMMVMKMVVMMECWYGITLVVLTIGVGIRIVATIVVISCVIVTSRTVVKYVNGCCKLLPLLCLLL